MAARCASPVDDCDHDHDDVQLDELDSSVNPSSVTDRYWVYCWHPQEEMLEETYGKWLVFRPKASGELDKIWHVIRQCVEAKEFGDGCTAAKCSTAIENPDEAPVGSPKGVICVYTTRKSINDVGLLLIEKVRETIRYKTDETTLRGLYAFKGHGRVTMRTLYWNDGKPSFGPRTLPPDVNPTSINDDAWVYCKPPLTLAPQSQDSRKNASGNWLVFEPMESLDETWHMIRRAVESREFGKGCTGAKCSTAFKSQAVRPNSDGVIMVSTTDEGKNEVGMILIHKVQHNILHKTFESGPPRQFQAASRRPYSQWSKKPIKTWLYWNNGEPSFDKN